METERLSGKKVADSCLEKLTSRIHALKQHGTIPRLRVMLVGDNPASKLYTSKKAEKCKEMGIDGEIINLEETISTDELEQIIHELNNDSSIHGILVQMPLPSHIDEQHIVETISPDKDVDGFHTINIGRLQMQDHRALVPCTALGIVELLKYYNIATEGKHVVVIGRSNIVGRPISQLLSAKSNDGNATVTLCHSRTKDMAYFTSQADILIAALGKPLFVTAALIKEGAVIIDVGINKTPEGSSYFGRKKIVGDVDYDDVLQKAKAVSPVPGGIGPMTIAMLLQNTVQAAENLTSTK